jgi:hypothetical protein
MVRPQRRKKFVDAKVQGALARRIVFHWFLFFAVAAVSTLALQVLSNPFRPTGEQIRELWWTHGPFLVVMLFLLPVFVLDSVKLSHRFAGPIFSLHRAIREVAAGKPPRKLKFRQGDFWHDLADDYNAMIARLTESGAPRETQEADEPVAATAQQA